MPLGSSPAALGLERLLPPVLPHLQVYCKDICSCRTWYRRPQLPSPATLFSLFCSKHPLPVLFSPLCLLRRLKPGSHPKLALARSRPSLTPSTHAPSSLEPWSHCFLIRILHWSGGACWVCGLSAPHSLGQEGIGSDLLSDNGQQ